MSLQIPQPVAAYIAEKREPNGVGGRPHFLARKERDPTDVVLDIAELTWVKQKSLGKVAAKMGTGYHTIYRILNDLAPYKEELVNLIETGQRRKTFWNRKLNTSDYETVQKYLDYAFRQELKSYKTILRAGEKVWKALGYKDPKSWGINEVVAFVKSLSEGTQKNYVDAVRAVAPQFRNKNSSHYLSVALYREKIQRRKKPLFGKDILRIHKAIDVLLSSYHKNIFDLHITLGAREGARNPKAGMTGVSWEHFQKGFSRVDIWESKVRSRGIWWRNCPVDLFFKDLPDRLRKHWEEEGKPRTGKVVRGGYKGLLQVWKEIQGACREYWEGKVDPGLLMDLSTLRPHDADKIHCNLCWEAEIPLEVVAGQYLGKSEGLGLVGRGWLSIDTIRKYYLSLSQRSDRYKRMLARVSSYASQFNGGALRCERSQSYH